MKFVKKSKDHLGRTVIKCSSCGGLRKHRFVRVQIGGTNYWLWFKLPQMSNVLPYTSDKLDKWLKSKNG